MKTLMLTAFCSAEVPINTHPEQPDNCSSIVSTDTCALPEAQIQKMISTNSSEVIDLRGADDYQKLFIPRSRILTPFEIKSKPYLKSRPVVLIDRPEREGHLRVLCESLRESGFSDIHYLRGGLRSWVSKGGRTQGELSDLENVEWISPIDLYSDLSFRQWRILEVPSGVIKPNAINDTLSSRLSVLNDSEEKQVSAKILAAYTSETTPIAILTSATSAERWRASLSQLPIPPLAAPIFIVQGGRTALENALRVAGTLKIQNIQCR